MTDPVRAVLSLGSNLGNREATIRDAVRAIAGLSSVSVVGVSGLVETAALKPHGVDPSAPPYLNAVVVVDTTREPLELLDGINGVEHDHGRIRDERWGDRTLDIDIVSMGELVLSTDRLTLPHPRAHERGFVLVPWLQVEPDAVLPGYGRVRQLAAADAVDVRTYPAEGLM